MVSARDFSGHCDGHAPTLALNQDKRDGKQFWGFTPVEWGSWLWNGEFGSESNFPKADPS
jgi:hypothetical protein